MNEYLEHIVVSGERWDSLAWHYYGDASRYEPILRANPGLRDARGQWPIVPPEGVRLLIPVLPAPKLTTRNPVSLPPWLR